MAKRYFPALERVNPFRKLDWRWQRAGHLVCQHRPFLPHRDDAATGRCMAYLRDRLRGADLHRQHHALDAAHAVYAGGGDRRVTLEARILAADSDEDIAAKVGLSPAAVGAFHDTFFDVRELVLRRASDWVTIRACGHTPGSLNVANRHVLLRLLGFFGGPHVLDLISPFLTDGFDLASDAVPAGVDPSLAKSIKLNLRLMLLPDTQETRRRFIRAGALLNGDAPSVEALTWVLDPLEGSDRQKQGSKPTATGAPSVSSDAVENVSHKQEVTAADL